MTRRVVLVAAYARGRVIGQGGALPWHLPADLRHFREVTRGHTVVMGRATYDSIGRALPGRRNVVLSTTLAAAPPGTELARSVAEVLAHPGDLMIIGGAQVYAALLAHATHAELTEIDLDVAGDTHLPALGPEWHEVARQGVPPDDPAGTHLSFITLRRTT